MTDQEKENYQRIVKELEAEPERLRVILREQRETIKHWQHHALITSKLLGCIAIDKDIEAAIDALKRQPSLSDAIKEVENLSAEVEAAKRTEARVATSETYRLAHLHLTTLASVIERLKSLGTQREEGKQQ
jgi:hypothetical protein